jgi:hypothetical protein
LLVVCHLGLLLSHDLAARPGLTFTILSVAFLALAWIVFGARRFEFSAAGILLVALGLRVLLLPLAPTLSDDVLRYLWDGKVVGAGANPYALAPDAEVLSTLRDSEWERMPHRDVETVYPPLALALFSIAAALPRSLIVWKILLVAFDLAGCWLLLRLAAASAIDARRVALYAWNPLVTLEVAAMGHVDALGVTLVIATVWALENRRAWAPVAAAGSVLAKLVPIIALPLWARRSPNGGSFLAISLTTVAAALVPVWVLTGGMPPGWVRFGISWEFNGPLYEPLWRALDASGLAGVVKGALDQLKGWTGQHEFWNRFYPYVYPQLMAKAALALLLGVLLWRVWRDRQATAVEATGRTFAALVICSATVYPWYLLWMLPWAALACQRAWLGLSALILLSYLPQTTAFSLMPWVFLSIWLPFAGLLWRYRSWSTV